MELCELNKQKMTIMMSVANGKCINCSVVHIAGEKHIRCILQKRS